MLVKTGSSYAAMARYRYLKGEPVGPDDEPATGEGDDTETT